MNSSSSTWRGKTPIVSRRVDSLLWPDVFGQIRHLLTEYGGKIIFCDLRPLYENIYPEADIRRFFYAGLSNGKDILLHDRQRTGEVCVRYALDSLHLFGHMHQWHMDSRQARPRKLRFWGRAAQAMATASFVGASTRELHRMQTYEIEANRLGLAIFSEGLRRLCPPISTGKNSTNLLVDLRRYVARDITFLTSYYVGSTDSDYPAVLLCEEEIFAKVTPVGFPTAREIAFSKIDQICVPVIHGSDATMNVDVQV